MSSHKILRPGSRLGVYPQKLDTARSGFEQLASDWIDQAAQIASWRKFRPSYVLTRVNKAAIGLELLDDSGLQSHYESIRYKLHRDGLESDLIFSAFALIREFAKRSLQMCHYDVQIFGGWIIINGNMAEMATGEGKSFTATLPAATAAMGGIPVHVITSNEYLAERDAEEMRPLYEAMGLSVAVVLESMSADVKRQAYASDIVYCTNKQVAFDYLRDRLISRNESGRLALKFGDASQTEQLLLRGLCFAILDEADSVLIDDARTPLILSQEHQDEQREVIYEQAMQLATQMEESRDFLLFQREHRLELTEAGKAWLADHTQALDGVWSGARHSQLLVQQALTAIHFLRKDYHYLLRDDKIEIVDKNTGRAMPDRSWQQGLHQLVELKEGCPMSGQRETIASIAYQRFFRRYLRLGGMSGTLGQVSQELQSLYRQQVIPVPLHRPLQRRNLGCAMYRRSQDKWLAVANQVRAIHASGQPILVGMRSVADSELLSKLLTRLQLQHRILNARQDKEEAEIVAQAGQRGQITVATNMAGRGTDIKLGPGVAELGGLHVIATERNEEYRIDQQLYGRSARQGDPGSYQAILSMNDELVQDFYAPWLRRLLGRYAGEGQPLPSGLSQLLIWLPQRQTRSKHRALRRDLLSMDDKLGKLLAYSGRSD